jgi:hypothetical protein
VPVFPGCPYVHSVNDFKAEEFIRTSPFAAHYWTVDSLSFRVSFQPKFFKRAAFKTQLDQHLNKDSRIFRDLQQTLCSLFVFYRPNHTKWLRPHPRNQRIHEMVEDLLTYKGFRAIERNEA